MPFMDGYECTKIIHQILEENELPKEERPAILAVTGHVELEYQLKALQSGMEQIYSKPITFDIVSRILLEQGFKVQIPKSVEKDLKQKKREIRAEELALLKTGPAQA